MNLYIENFCALSKVNIDLQCGINILAGKNGTGKSQLLMAIAHQYGNQTLRKQGFEDIDLKIVEITPKPKKVLWRQPIRNIGSGTKGQKFATLSPPSYYQREDDIGYTWNVDERYNNLHNTLTNMYVAGNLNGASSASIDNWKTLRKSFNNVFNKEIDGEFTSNAGRIGLRLSANDLSRFDTLSTGELEYLSLLCDLLTEKDVELFLIDEIDAHFHPNLQGMLINEIKNIVDEKYLLFTTHSPSLMLSVPTSNVFYLKHSNDVKENENQAVCIKDDITLLDSLAEMYSGFVTDLRVGNHYFESANYELLRYANECLGDSATVGSEKASDTDPQTSILRGLLLNSQGDFFITEIGAGKGRLLQAFQALSDDCLNKIHYTAVDIDNNSLGELQDFSKKLGIDKKFKSFKCQVSCKGCSPSNLFIMANILHEIGPDNLHEIFNDIFSLSKNESTILILEALELAVGEKRYVLFDDDSLKEIFKSHIAQGNLTMNCAKPNSFKGTPLLEIVIRVSTDQEINIDKSDVVRGLKRLIDNNSSELAGKINTISSLNARSLAFKSHNIANANIYLKLLEKR